MSFQLEYDATITASKDLDLPRHSGASSNSQHTAASRIPTLLKLGSSGTGLATVLADYHSVDSRNSIRETCADLDRETFCFQSFLGLNQKGREIEIKTLCKHCERGKISTKSLNGKLNWLCEEKNWLSKDYTKLRQTGTLSTRRKEIQILLFPRSIRSSSPNDYSYDRLISGLIRLKEIKEACMENWK